jgi:hypothetical protein
LKKSELPKFPHEVAALENGMRSQPQGSQSQGDKQHSFGDLMRLNEALGKNLKGVSNSGLGKLQVTFSDVESNDCSYTGRGLKALAPIKSGDVMCTYVGKHVTNKAASASYSDYILLNCDAEDLLEYSFGPFIQVKPYSLFLDF